MLSLAGEHRGRQERWLRTVVWSGKNVTEDAPSNGHTGRAGRQPPMRAGEEGGEPALRLGPSDLF